MVNLKWHDAVAVAAAQFKTKKEREAGWPQTMTIEQAAALQRPYLHKTEPGYRASLGKTKAMADAIFQACEKGSIEWSTETRQTHHQITRIVPGDIRYAKRNLYGERVITPRQELAWATKDVQVKAITAQAFAAWLAEPTQDEKPSAHIAAWFEAVGVNPQSEAATDETLEARNDRWLAYYEADVKAGGKLGAYARGSKHFNVDRSKYNKAVKKAADKRAEKHRAGFKAVPAKSGRWGSTLVKDGKKTKGTKA